jgi:tetratricopeptide (TPR) repeat protein
MKKFSLIILLLIGILCPASGQNAESLLGQVTQALSLSHWQEAGNLFCLAVDADVFRSECYLKESVTADNPARPFMLLYLGDYFRRNRNYDAADIYYKDLVALKPDISNLSRLAEMELQLGHEVEALNAYQIIADKDEKNLSANIFLGNYYFCRAEKNRAELERNYKKIVNPSRMQTADYHNNQQQVFNVDYKRSRLYLQRVLKLFPSTEVGKTLKKIKEIESSLTGS